MQWLLSYFGLSSPHIVLGLMMASVTVGCAEGGSVGTPSSTSTSQGGSTSSGGGGAGTGAVTIGGMGSGAGGGATGGKNEGGSNDHCGNGVIDVPEDCDNELLGTGTCADVVGVGSVGSLACTAQCTYDISGCSAPPLCGNGAIDVGEDCDDTLLGPATCADLIGAGSTGVVSCTPGCTYDASSCSAPPGCPNGNVDPGEDCDGANLDGKTCASVLMDPQATGPLACNANCTFNTAACISCGDGNVTGTEQCDGLNLDGASCVTLLGAGATGSLACGPACTYDASNCARCGDGILQVGEQCDDGNGSNGDGCDSCQVVCLAGEEQFGLNCYVDLPSSDTDWLSADAACSSVTGGHLVTITSAGENDFVYFMMDPSDTNPRWIGLHDRNIEGSFVWTTGEPVSYTNWDSGEPNNSGNEDCVEFFYYPNDWNDEACSSIRAFICEFEPPVQFP